MMNRLFLLATALAFFFCSASAQQTVTVISKCGGVDTVTIPSIIDNDLDGMDDALEQRLLNYFMPTIIQFNDESCPGPALNGTGDSNLVVCHIYPLPQQYTFSNNLDSVLQHPVALVPKKGLVTGLIWYDPLIKVNTALIYGKDCGLSGHTADVEGFNYSIKYIGPDTLAGWMYDTVIPHWMGGTIQTISHEGTLCEQIETHPYKSALFPNGLDTVYASPDKHGNYLTISGCGSSFICNPGCGGIPSVKIVRAINLGEPNAPLITDLGSAYAAYAGNNPWSSSNFLSANGGNAGAIPTKMILKLTSNFIQGTTLTTQAQICNIYSQCFSTGSSYTDFNCTGSVYNFFNQPLTTSGTYYHTLTSSYGCDSTIALTLSVYPVSTFQYSTSSCGSYNFNGHQLITSGIYRDTLTNIHGCDSIVILTLNVHSTVFTAFDVSVCAGNSYNFNNELLTATGVYIDTITTATGCDSIITLSFMVDTLPPVTWNFNTDTIASNSHPILLTGGTPTGGVYSGTGVVGNLFYPNLANAGVNTLTYVYTDLFGCSDSVSKIFVVLVSDILKINATENSILFYPNPAHGKLNFIFSNMLNEITLTLNDIRGVEWKKLVLKTNDSSIDISGLPAGIYILRVMVNGQNLTTKLVVDW